MNVHKNGLRDCVYNNVYDVSCFFFSTVIDSLQIVDGLVSVVVTPHSVYSHIEWKVNGETVPNENDVTFSLPLTIHDNDQVEVVVSSDCGATDTDSIFISPNNPSLMSSTSSSQVSTTGNVHHN